MGNNSFPPWRLFCPFIVTVSKQNNENTTEGITDPVDKAVYKFSNHPSILKIKDHCQNVGSFHFQKVTPDAVDREVRDLNPKKATTHKNIPPKILKSTGVPKKR